MKPKPIMCPGDGDVLSNFINNVRQDLKAHITTEKPEGYWESLDQVFEKATTWALNNKASSRLAPPSATLRVSAPARKELNAIYFTQRNQKGRKGRPSTYYGCARTQKMRGPRQRQASPRPTLRSGQASRLIVSREANAPFASKATLNCNAHARGSTLSIFTS